MELKERIARIEEKLDIKNDKKGRGLHEGDSDGMMKAKFISTRHGGDDDDMTGTGELPAEIISVHQRIEEDSELPMLEGIALRKEEEIMGLKASTTTPKKKRSNNYLGHDKSNKNVNNNMVRVLTPENAKTKK